MPLTRLLDVATVCVRRGGYGRQDSMSIHGTLRTTRYGRLGADVAGRLCSQTDASYFLPDSELRLLYHNAWNNVNTVRITLRRVKLVAVVFRT